MSERSSAFAPCGKSEKQRKHFKSSISRWLKKLRKKSEQQIPRGLKPARDDKNEELTAHLKVRPFKTSAIEVFRSL